jgi:hypothetical protein
VVAREKEKKFLLSPGSEDPGSHLWKISQTRSWHAHGMGPYLVHNVHNDLIKVHRHGTEWLCHRLGMNLGTDLRKVSIYLSYVHFSKWLCHRLGMNLGTDLGTVSIYLSYVHLGTYLIPTLYLLHNFTTSGTTLSYVPTYGT